MTAELRNRQLLMKGAGAAGSVPGEDALKALLLEPATTLSSGVGSGLSTLGGLSGGFGSLGVGMGGLGGGGMGGLGSSLDALDVPTKLVHDDFELRYTPRQQPISSRSPAGKFRMRSPVRPATFRK